MRIVPSNVRKKIKDLLNVIKVQSYVMLTLDNVKMVSSNVRKNKGTIECDKTTVTYNVFFLGKSIMLLLHTMVIVLSKCDILVMVTVSHLTKKGARYKVKHLSEHMYMYNYIFTLKNTIYRYLFKSSIRVRLVVEMMFVRSTLWLPFFI